MMSDKRHKTLLDELRESWFSRLMFAALLVMIAVEALL